MIQDPNTKEIKYPSTEDVQGFRSKYGLPCVLGATDGSLIPMRKPFRDQTGGDKDACWCYKGHIASLLLRIVDVNGLFCMIVRVRRVLWVMLDDWLVAQLKAPLDIGEFSFGERLEYRNKEQFVQGYLVGDAAFGLSKTMLKCHDGVPAENTPEGKFNRAIIHSRHAVECTFGRLKGRCAYCNRNTFWSSPTVTRDAIQVCCGLHNSLQKRSVGRPEEGHIQGGDLGQVDVELEEGSTSTCGSLNS